VMFAASPMDSAFVNFSEAYRDDRPFLTRRENMHRAAQRIVAAHPEFSYIEAVRMLERA